MINNWRGAFVCDLLISLNRSSRLTVYGWPHNFSCGQNSDLHKAVYQKNAVKYVSGLDILPQPAGSNIIQQTINCSIRLKMDTTMHMRTRYDICTRQG